MEPRFAHLMSRPRRAAGISLAETIIVIGIMGMLLLIMNQMFISSLDLVRKQTARNDNEAGAVNDVRTISDAARGAAAVVLSRSMSGVTYTSTADSLVLKIPAVDSSGNILSNVYDYLAIAHATDDVTKIFATTEGGTGSVRKTGRRLLSSYNQTLTFRYNNPDVTKATRISVYVINRQTVRQVQLTTRAWTSLFLRNYYQ